MNNGVTGTFINAKEFACKEVYHRLKPETKLYARAIGQAFDPSRTLVDFPRREEYR